MSNNYIGGRSKRETFRRAWNMREWYESRLTLAIEQGYLNLAHCIASTPIIELESILGDEPKYDVQIRDIMGLAPDDDLVSCCKLICRGHFVAESL